MNDAKYAQFCKDVYDDPAPTIEGTGINTNIHVKMLAGDDDSTIVVFRGSKETRDWILDLWAIPSFSLDIVDDFRLGALHTGFYVGAKSVSDELADRLKRGTRMRPYVLCGHSLGGALALIAAGLLICRGLPAPARIATFGAPRAGMQRLSNFLLQDDVRQYRFGADIIPYAPEHPYCHVREPLIQIGEPIISADIFANHHIDNYVTALAAAVPPQQ